MFTHIIGSELHIIRLSAPLEDRSRTSYVQIRASYFVKLGQIGVRSHVVPPSEYVTNYKQSQRTSGAI